MQQQVLRRLHEVAGQVTSKEEFLARFAHTRCPLCNIPKGKHGCHHLSRCKWLKYIGLDISEMKYDKSKDERQPFEQRESIKNKTQLGLKKNEEDENFSALGNGDNGTRTDDDGGRDNDDGGRGGRGRGGRGGGRGQGRGRGRSVTFCPPTPPRTNDNNDATLDNVVGKNGKDTKNDEDAAQAIQNNLQKQKQEKQQDQQQQKEEERARSIRRSGLRAFDEDTWVDASEVEDKIKNGCGIYTDAYCRYTVKYLLDCSNRRDPDTGIYHCCLASCRYIPNSQHTKDDVIVVDSSATSHMRRNRTDFESDYVRCKDTFVIMGDGTEVPVVGFGTSRVKSMVTLFV